MSLLGVPPEKMEQRKNKGLAKLYLLQFLGVIITNATLSYVLNRWGVSSVSEGKPIKLYWINAGHYLVTLIVSAVILSVWR